MNHAIILVNFNRIQSLKRMLFFIEKSSYRKNTTLIISIDKSDIETENIIINISEDFNWQHGEKLIRTFPERQGLRNHILACGDLTEEYESITILEDDIIVAENFHIYALKALDFYADDENIAGISLYAPNINEMVLRPFTPMPTNFDTYFMQSAQSWGQCWSRKMWKQFRDWYDKNSDSPLIKNDDMPSRIYSWPESSWKKYFMKYIVEESKFFVYPYVSLSSNASDIGHHNKIQSNLFQVPLLSGIKEDYKFPTFSEGIKYDVFFERCDIYKKTKQDKFKICCDLYGEKPTNNSCRFILTNKALNLKCLESYSLSMRPHESNYLNKILGSDLYLYDTKDEELINITGKYNLRKNVLYHSFLDWQGSGLSFLYGLTNYILMKKEKYLSKIKKLLSR